MIGNTQKSPGQILQRLEELRKWQEQQQQLLIQRQNSQRQLLDEEQRLLYEKLGFSSPKATNNASHSQQEEVLMEGTPETHSCSLSPSGIVGIFPHSINENSPDPEGPCAEAKSKVKKGFLKKGEGIVSRFKVNPETFRLHNLPKYKYAHRPPCSKKCSTEKLPKKFSLTGPYKEPGGASQSKKEDRLESNNHQIPSTSAEKLPLNTKLFEENSTRSRDEQQRSDQMRQANSMSIANSTPISWADVLNPNNIQAVSLEGLKKYTAFNSTESSLLEDTDPENISLFELLEKKAQEGSILIDSSILKRWMENIRSPPKFTDAESMIGSGSAQLKRVSPIPCDIDKQILADELDEFSVDESEENESVLKYERQRVRFSDDVEINEINSESGSDVTLENDDSCLEESMLSVSSKQDLESRIESLKLAHGMTADAGGIDTLTSASMKSQQINLIEKTDLLKTRLADLEREISEFQKHNSELTKLKQECEIEKIRLAQEREEVEEKLKDERLKIEIQLHDERVQLETEKRKYDRLMKEHRTKARKESEEISRLRDQVEQLQNHNREKDAKHSAAQARLRAQIRSLEKDVKECNMELDVLKKERKRLEGENSRLMRQSSNKMLHEINKSIAKLVPKCTPTEMEVANKNTKPLVAKVISHSESISHRRLSKVPNKMPRSKPSKTLETSDESDREINKTKGGFFRQSSSVEPSDDLSETSEIEAPSNNAKTMSTDKAYIMQDELKREIISSDGRKDIWYTNGNLKKISADGMLIRMLYYNKDIKETNINEGTVKYYYAETNTWHTTYLDGLEILEFPNGQTEHRYKDGTIEVHFENGSIRITNPTDPAKEEEWRYPDGTRLVQLKTGDKILSFPNGQKEIHTKLHKRREYPDGTVKVVYPDGSQETRYSNGRIRLKDKDGNLVMDSEQ